MGILLGGLRLDLSYLDSFLSQFALLEWEVIAFQCKRKRKKIDPFVQIYISKGNLQRTFWKVVLRMSFVMVIRFNFA